MAIHKSATIPLTLLLLLLSFHLEACSGARLLVAQEPTSTTFIKTSCVATAYPALCFTSLSSYASTIQTSPMQLASVALSVSLSGARNASSAMAKAIAAGRASLAPPVAAAMADCVENMGDSVSELKDSLAAMGSIGRGSNPRSVAFQINNVQTWVSAALTNEDTCMDGFAGNAMNGEAKNMVRSHVVKVAQLTSNALALVNGLASALSSP